MQYHADSTLKQIQYNYGEIFSSTVFKRENGLLKEFASSRSMYKNSIHYDRSRISQLVNGYKEIQLPNGSKMQYGYNNDGIVSTLKYFTINEGGETLKMSCVYHYNNNKELTKVITTEGANSLTHTIESYSDSTYFDPLMFIDTGLMEDFVIFSIPVLSKMNKYPAKIIREVKLGTEPQFVDKITSNACEIQDRHIRKLTIKVTSPGMPGYEPTVTGTFKYE